MLRKIGLFYNSGSTPNSCWEHMPVLDEAVYLILISAVRLTNRCINLSKKQ